MVYDSYRRRTVLFGGTTTTGGGLSDTWEWDGANWQKMKSPKSPQARVGHTMTYDSVSRQSILTGGWFATAAWQDTWEWDGRTWAELILNSPDTQGSAAAFDVARNRTVMFPADVAIWQTAEFDGRAWKLLKTAPVPMFRLEHVMAYDAARRRVVLFGGVDNGSAALRDTWEWDGRGWTQNKTTIDPGPRYESGMAYDSVRQRMVLYGGFSGRNLPTDTWEYGIPNLTLTANTPTLPITGGMQTLTLNAGTDLKNKSYWMFGSMTGTLPGIVLSGIHIPLRIDPYTDLTISFANGKEFTNFKGTLSATGTATASLNVPTGLGIPKGFKFYHAYVVYDGTTGQVFTSSNPVSAEFK